MLNLKKGDKIENKNGAIFKVQIIADGGAMIAGMWYTDSEIEANFILPKEKWAPREGERYYAFDATFGIYSSIYGKAINDDDWVNSGNCFQTEAEAQKVVEEIKKILNK